jgi:putative ABC transport system ATP-binding protein
MYLCELKGVDTVYGTGPHAVRALKNIRLDIDVGEFTVFSGPSGSGKTTLLNLIGCLNIPTTGNVYLEEQDVASLTQRKLAHHHTY